MVLFAAPVFAAIHQVDITLTTFSPASLTIQTGDTVVWRNNSFLQHTVTSGNSCSPTGLFNSGVLDPDLEFSHTFTSTGSFNYFCIIHCLANMRGTVTVDAPVPVKPTTWGAIKALYAAAQR
jgi:plastocyanin